MTEAPVTVHTTVFKAFDFTFGGPSVQQIIKGIELLAGEKTFWLGATQYGNAKYALMAHEFSFDDQNTGSHVLVSFLPSMFGDASGIVTDTMLCQKVLEIGKDSLCPGGIANEVNIPALLFKLYEKSESLSDNGAEGNSLRDAAMVLQTRILSSNIYSAEELDHLIALTRAKLCWDLRNASQLFPNPEIAESVANALKKEGFGEFIQQNATLVASDVELNLLRGWQLSDCTPRMRADAAAARGEISKKGAELRGIGDTSQAAKTKNDIDFS